METRFVEKIEELIYSKLSKEIYKVKNIYLFGSRAYQCEDKNSDYDLVVIISGSDYFFYTILIETEDLNLSVYHEDFFRGELNKHIIVPIMCLYLPKNLIWKEEIDFRKEYVFSLINLKKGALQDASHNLAKAKRLWSEGEIAKSKKNVVHGLRYLYYTLQLIEHEKIIDITTGNNIKEEIFQMNSLNWKDYEEKYEPQYQKIFHYLEHELPIRFLPSKNKLKQNKEFLLLEHIETFGLSSLHKELSFVVTEIIVNSSNKLLHIVADENYSPEEYKVTLQVWNGCILREKQEENNNNNNVNKKKYQVVCYSFEKFIPSCPFENILIPLSSYAKDFDWKNSCVFEKYDGIHITMYCLNNKWSICTKQSFDGSEFIYQEFHTRVNFKRNFFCAGKNQEKKEKEFFLFQLGEFFGEKNLEELKTKTIADLFWKIFYELESYKLPNLEFSSFNYSFELIFPFFPCITTYKVPELILHGVRNLETFEELNFEEFGKKFGFKTPKKFDSFPQIEVEKKERELPEKTWKKNKNILGQKFPYSDFKLNIIYLLGQACKINPFVQEGFVVCDSQLRRICIKSPQFLAIQILLKENSIYWEADYFTNVKLFVEIIRTNKSLSGKIFVQDYQMNPRINFLQTEQWKSLFFQVYKKCENVCSFISKTIEQVKNIKDQLEFVEEVKQIPYYGIIYAYFEREILFDLDVFLATNSFRTFWKWYKDLNKSSEEK